MIVTYFFIAVFVVCAARAIRSAWAAAYGEKVNLSANDEGSPRRFPLARFLHHTGGGSGGRAAVPAAAVTAAAVTAAAVPAAAVRAAAGRSLLRTSRAVPRPERAVGNIAI